MLRLPIAIATLCVFAHAQDPAVLSEKDWKIHLELQAIELPAKTARALLPSLRDEKQMPEAWKRIEGLLDSGEAKPGLNLVGQSTDGHEVKISNGEEIRYPIEPPRIEVVEPISAKPTASAKSDNQDVTFAPNTFEKRTVGLTFDGSFFVSADGKRLLVTSSFERSWLLGWDELEIGRLRNNDKILYKQPHIALANSRTSFGLTSGERVLLSAHPLPNQPDRMEILVLHVWTTPRMVLPER